MAESIDTPKVPEMVERVKRELREQLTRARIVDVNGRDIVSSLGPIAIHIREDEAARNILAAMREPTKEMLEALSFEGHRFQMEECTDGTYMIIDGYRSARIRDGLTAADEPLDIEADMNAENAWECVVKAMLGEPPYHGHD